MLGREDMLLGLAESVLYMDLLLVPWLVGDVVGAKVADACGCRYVESKGDRGQRARHC
jgi:hypothetical protein